MPTIQETRDSILTIFHDAWTGANPTYPVVYQDSPVQKPSTLLPWARVTLTHVSGRQATLCGADGSQRFRREGVLFVQIFTPMGDGLTRSDSLTNVVIQAFEGQRFDGGFFKNVRVNEIGPDGDHYQVNVIAEFEWDQIH